MLPLFYYFYNNIKVPLFPITEEESEITIFYDFEIDSTVPQNDLSTWVNDGINDSGSEIWINLDEMNIENASPVVMKVKQELLGEPELNKSIYKEWIVK